MILKHHQITNLSTKSMKLNDRQIPDQQDLNNLLNNCLA